MLFTSENIENVDEHDFFNVVNITFIVGDNKD